MKKSLCIGIAYLSPMSFLSKHIDVSTFMQKWWNIFFNKFREKIRKQKVLLELYVEGGDEESSKRYFKQKQKLKNLLIHEELSWKHRV